MTDDSRTLLAAQFLPDGEHNTKAASLVLDNALLASMSSGIAGQAADVNVAAEILARQYLSQDSQCATWPVQARQGTVAVDQATQLVNIKKVPVIIGGIISPISIPILTSVTAPAGVVQVSPASSSPTLTALARDGKTNGVFFRTITSDALQGTAAAKYAIDQGLKSRKDNKPLKGWVKTPIELVTAKNVK